jgi:hypothetical protein
MSALNLSLLIYIDSEKGKDKIYPVATLPETITHPSYPEHKLRLVTASGGKPFRCDGCKEPGDGPRYHCHTCGFNMHNYCAHAPATLRSNTLFPGRTFTLHVAPPPGPPEKPHPHPAGERGSRWCDTCGDSVRGLVYHCSGANLDLHPCCASLHLQELDAITIGGVAFDIAASRHCSICSCRQEEECRCCRRLGRRHEQWCYVHDDDGEQIAVKHVSLHVSCIKQIARRRWQAGRDMKCGGQIMLASEEMMDSLQGISSAEARNIVRAVVRIITAVIFGDQTAIEGDVTSWSALNLQWLKDLFGI